MNYFPKFAFLLLATTTGASVSVSAASSTVVLKQQDNISNNARIAEAENLELSVELLAQFHAWTEEHDKTYENDEEKRNRLKVWMANDEKIREHNNQNPPPTFTLGHNPYSDMTQDEFHRHFKLGQYSSPPSASMVGAGVGGYELFEQKTRGLLEAELPEEGVNWIGLGGVTPVKDQGFCGACWAFSTTGALEGAKFIKTGELTSLSEQNLLDCDHQDLGCSGGLMDNAFKFDEKSGGLCSESDYPYKAKQGICMTNCTDVPGSIVKTFIDVPVGSTKALVAALTLQPVSVAIQANQFVFQFYKTGVITDDSCGARGDIDHGVLAVGYGVDEETQEPYFLVKNSWGEKWGLDGYVKMSRSSKNQWGMCSILKMASFPEVE